MSALQVVWAVALIATLTMLPVGAVRMVIYKSGEVDHTPALRLVARLALGVGGVALAVLLLVTVWFLATGQRPL
jgi:hypothetical protein